MLKGVTGGSTMPITVSGSNNVGDVKTARINGGTGSIQWAQYNSSTGAYIGDIVGFTSTTYTIRATDLGYIVGAYLTAYQPFSHGTTPVPAPLRAVTVNNQVNTTTATSVGYDRYHIYTNVDIGSGDVSNLVASFMNWYLTGIYNDGPATYYIEAMTFENTARTISAPYTFGGARSSAVIPVGANDIQGDTFPASRLSLASFTRGYRAWMKITFRLPSKGASIVATGGRNTSASPAGCQNFWSASDVDIGLSSIDTPGPWTWSTSPGVGSFNSMPCPVVLGHFAAGDPQTWYNSGDSIAEDTGETTFTEYGAGEFQRALVGTGVANQLLAGLCWARGGITIAGLVSDAKIAYWQKYCKGTFEEIGTNTFGTAGTVTSVTVQGQITPLWTTYRNSGSQYILRTKLLPRTTGAWTLADQSDQTYVAGWAPAGNVATFNDTWLPTQVGGAIDALLPLTSVRGTLPMKWQADGTVNKYTIDGTHPSSFAHTALSVEIRAGMDASGI